MSCLFENVFCSVVMKWSESMNNPLLEPILAHNNYCLFGYQPHLQPQHRLGILSVQLPVIVDTNNAITNT